MDSFRDRFQVFLDLEAQVELDRIARAPGRLTRFKEVVQRWFVDTTRHPFNPVAPRGLSAEAITKQQALVKPRTIFKASLHPHDEYGQVAVFYTSTPTKHTRYADRFDTIMRDDELIILTRYHICPDCHGTGQVNDGPCGFVNPAGHSCNATGWLLEAELDRRRLPPATEVVRYATPSSARSLIIHEQD